MSADQINMIAYFLRSSNVIEAIYKYQSIYQQSLDYVASLYEIVRPELLNETTKIKHFEIIREIFKDFNYETIKLKSNQ